jgi:DnaJ-class molecular chaperone
MNRAEAFAVLGIPSGSPPDEIKTAYRRARSAAHPDLGGKDGDFGRVQEAYDLLSGNVSNSATQPNATRPFSASPVDTWFHNLGKDLSNPKNGLKKTVEWGFHEDTWKLYSSSYLSFNYPVIIVSMGLSQMISGYTVGGTLNDGYSWSVKIPNGLPDGMSITTAAIKNGEPNRPVHVKVNVELPMGFKFYEVAAKHRGNFIPGHLISQIDISMLDLIMGSWTKVKNTDGEEFIIRIPAGTQPGTKIRLKDQGYFEWGGNDLKAIKRHDLLLEVVAVTPQISDIKPALIKELLTVVESNNS